MRRYWVQELSVFQNACPCQFLDLEMSPNGSHRDLDHNLRPSGIARSGNLGDSHRVDSEFNGTRDFSMPICLLHVAHWSGFVVKSYVDSSCFAAIAMRWRTAHLEVNK